MAALAVAVALAAWSGASYRGVSRAPASGRPRVATVQVLVPTWLPPGFDASGHGDVSPPGGLRVGPDSGVSVGIIGFGTGPSEQVPVAFSLTYYGSQPIGQSLRLMSVRLPTYLPRGPVSLEPSGSGYARVRAGGRLVTLAPGAAGSYAVWHEEGSDISVVGQGVSIAQMKRFVAGLVTRSVAADQPVPHLPETVCTYGEQIDHVAVDEAQLDLTKGTNSSWRALAVITDRSRIKLLLGSVCRLPAIPKGFAFSSCPPDSQLTYQIDFDRGYEVLGEADVHVTGCRLVTGVGPARTTDAAFWAVLHREAPGGGRPAS